VRILRLVGVQVSAKFLKNLHCPELLTLDLLNSTIEKNSFTVFGFLPKLRKLTVTRSRLSAEDIAAIANNRIHLVGNPYQEFQPQIPEKPPHLFELPSNGGSTYTLKY
jgi:predicted DNA binding CopG/RHH family protein